MARYTPRSPRPRGITADQWENLCSPENYTCDGELTAAQAAVRFDRNVCALLTRARQAGSQVSTPRVAQPARTPQRPYWWHRAMSRPCSFCHAAPGTSCRTKGGQPSEPHQARRYLRQR